MSIYKDKVIWVTGASSGIGIEMVRQLAAKGAKLVLSSRNEDKLTEIKNTLTKPSSHLVLPLDLENSASFDILALKVNDHFGRIDFLFNNGGLSQRSNVRDTPIEVDRRIMEINYFGNIFFFIFYFIQSGYQGAQHHQLRY